MKNRKTSSHDNLTSTKSITDTSKSQSDFRTKRKSSGNSFFKKSAELLQSYKCLFNKPTVYNFGDADTFFRHSLRNYDDFEITKSIKWEDKNLRPDKSFEALNLLYNTKSLNYSPYFGQGDTKSKRKFKKELKGRKVADKLKHNGAVGVEISEKEETEETETLEDFEIFYSPNSQVEEEKLNRSDYLSLYQPPIAPTEGLLDTKLIEKVATVEEVQEEEDEDDSVSNDLFKMADEELEDVEDLVAQAGSELSAVVAENPSLQEAIETGDAADNFESEVEGGDSSEAPMEIGETSEATELNVDDRLASESEDEGTSKQVPSLTTAQGNDVVKTRMGAIDEAVIKELEDAEKQAMETAKIIYELKERVAQLLGKSKMTEVEAKELEEKNRQLRDQMCLFETKTKRIQFLVDQANFFDDAVPSRPPMAPERKYNEDILPKVIICGMTENNMPKIIVCDDKKRRSGPGKPKASYSLPPPVSVMPQFAKRLSESYYMQERLAAENADLEGKRYRLQEDLLDKDQTVESLQRKLNSLQGEMRMVCKENSLLSEKLQQIESCPVPCSKGDSDQYLNNPEPPCKKHPKKQKMPCGKNKGPCPVDVESRLQEYSDTTQQLEKQLGDMENEVRTMQSELVAVQKERQHLEQHRKMMCPPCPPPPCAPPKPPCPGPCNPRMGASPEQQLRELREQYNRLQDDYKAKLTEVGGLRADIEKLKQTAKDVEELKKAAEEKVKECEKEMKGFKTEKNKFMGSKEQLVEQEQQLNVAKQRFREAQDELEELRALIQDQQAQLDDYRNKYLQAQQQVEEQRRQIDMMEMENNRISEQVNLEIQRVKNQFQEKLQELTPLPDILKATQLKLQEAQQMHLLAERNNEALVHELQAYRDKAAAMANQMEKVRSDQQLGADENASIAQRAHDCERKLNEAVDENDTLKADLARIEELAEQNETRVQEKLHEIAQLMSQLETVREESARQVARTKDRCETVRRSMQNQIADLERQLAQSRAQARSAQKDRDDIRQKMQSQINNLNENFEDAQMRIRNLQGHVNFLKNSYTSVFPPNEGMVSDGMDGCDCGNNY